MKALIVSYQRGRHIVHQNHALIKIDGIGERAKASSLNGKKVSYTTKGGKVLNGVITKAHGGKGLVLARFETGLPGQAIGSEVAIKE